MSSLKLNSALNREHTEVLAIHCSDHRFQAGLYEVLNHQLKLGENYDLLAIPGGPQCLASGDHAPQFSAPVWEWVRFLVDAHRLKRLILIQHQDCQWYGTVPLHLHSSPDLRLRQEEDLRRAKTSITRDRPHLSVDLYFTGWDANQQITIEAISDLTSASAAPAVRVEA